MNVPNGVHQGQNGEWVNDRNAVDGVVTVPLSRVDWYSIQGMGAISPPRGR